MGSSTDVRAGDGRVLRVHASAESPASSEPISVLWHHGSPQTGALVEPLLVAAAARGIRLFSYGRPGYGGSSPRPGRNVASAAADVADIAEALGIDRFAVMGHSGGGPHALACAALLPGRVMGVVALSSLAPFGGDGLDWYRGMNADGASLRAAEAGREARAAYETTAAFDREMFTSRDWTALQGAWKSLGADAGKASAAGADGLIDDDCAYVAPWGFDVADITVPVLLVQGGEDRIVPPPHADWLLKHCKNAEVWIRPRDGHISVLDACAVGMDWLMAATARVDGRPI